MLQGRAGDYDEREATSGSDRLRPSTGAGERGPKLWLAAEDEITDSGEGAKHAHFKDCLRHHHLPRPSG